MGITTGNHNKRLQNKVVRDGHITFSNKDMIAIPGTGCREPFVVKVTGGTFPIFEKQI